MKCQRPFLAPIFRLLANPTQVHVRTVIVSDLPSISASHPADTVPERIGGPRSRLSSAVEGIECSKDVRGMVTLPWLAWEKFPHR